MHSEGYTTLDRGSYLLTIFEGADGLDSINDNVDVEVEFGDGRRYGATFFTLRNLEFLFAKNRQSGECAGGSYFWASDMVIVPELTVESIDAVVLHLVENGQVEEIFEGPFDDLEIGDGQEGGEKER